MPGPFIRCKDVGVPAVFGRPAQSSARGLGAERHRHRAGSQHGQQPLPQTVGMTQRAWLQRAPADRSKASAQTHTRAQHTLPTPPSKSHKPHALRSLPFCVLIAYRNAGAVPLPLRVREAGR